VKRVARIVGSAGLLGVLAWRVDLRGVAGALADVAWGWWLAALACYFLAQFVSAVRWRSLSRPLGFERPTRSYLAYVLAGNFFNLLLPTSVGGDVARAWYLGRGSGKGSQAVLSVLADRLNGLYVLIGMAFLAALVVPLPPWALAFVLLSAGVAAAGLALLWLASRERQRPEPCQNPPVADASGSPTGWQKRWHEMADALAFYRRSPRLLGSATLLSLAVQLLNVLLVWCLAGAVGAPVPLAFCFVLMPIVILLTLAPVSVNGMGVREGATLLLLRPLGVADGQAIALSLLWFSVFLAAGLTGGVWWLTGRLPRCEVPGDAERLCGDPDQGRAGQPATAA